MNFYATNLRNFRLSSSASRICIRLTFLSQVSAVAAATRLPPDDRQLAAFYAAQTATYGAHLSTAVEAFLRTIEMGQPPDVFLAHGKFVVLSAHRIVHVGDTVHR